MALSRDCRHGRQIGKCADCDLDHMEMAADAEARRVDELTALRKSDEALIRQLTDLVQAQHDYIMALPDDVVASLPAMPGFDGDWAASVLDTAGNRNPCAAGRQAMSRKEIIAMATEAGLNSYRIAPGEALAVWERFAALVAAREREECAQLAMEFRRGAGDPVCGEVAASIRARGKP